MAKLKHHFKMVHIVLYEVLYKFDLSQKTSSAYMFVYNVYVYTQIYFIINYNYIIETFQMNNENNRYIYLNFIHTNTIFVIRSKKTLYLHNTGTHMSIFINFMIIMV